MIEPWSYTEEYKDLQKQVLKFVTMFIKPH